MRGLLLAFAAALAVALTPTQALAAIGSIAGTVTDASSGEPIFGVEVCAEKVPHEILTKCESTGPSGQYTILNRPAGTYKVQFTPPSSGSDYVTQYYDGKLTWSEADLVTVTGGMATTGIDAQLEKGGRIEGKAIDASSKAPVPAIEVCAYRASDRELRRCTFSDEKGEYTVSPLAAGSYKLSFSPLAENLNYVEQYYHGKPSFPDADPVVVSAGLATTGIDVELQEGALAKGTVTGAEGGGGIERVLVCDYKASTGEQFECVETDANGRYTLSRLPPGSYKVGFDPRFNDLNYLGQYYDGKPSLAEADPIALQSGSTATDIDAELQRGSRIAGTAIDAISEEPIPYLEVCAYQESDGTEVRCTHTDPEGEYALVGLTGGEYKVGFLSIDYEEGTGIQNYVAQYYNDMPSLQSAEPLSVPAGGEVTGIDAEMREGARIKGKVIDVESKAKLKTLTACAVKVGETTVQRCATTNSNGEYGITALATGEYKVKFFDDRLESIYLTQYYDGKPTLDSADSISVTAGSDVSGIDAEMQEGGLIEGFLVEAGSGDPIEGIAVCALKPDGGLVRCAATEAGKFAIKGLEGSYKVVFSPESELFEEEYEAEYEARYFDEKESLAEADLVEVSAATATSGVDGVLTRTFPVTPANTEAPQLTGTTAVGTMLSCSPGSWKNSPTSYAYSWLRDGDPISGQGASTYLVQSIDAGFGISCEVTAGNAAGSASATSNTLQIPAGEDPTPGGGASGENPASAAPPGGANVPAGSPPQTPRAAKCKKDFRKKTVHGKARCVKVKRHKSHRGAR
jgi:hypothetical protein